MKITEKQTEKSRQLVSKLESIIARRTSLEKRKQQAMDEINTLQGKVSRLSGEFSTATAPEDVSRLQKELRAARFDLEDAESVSRVDVVAEVERMLNDVSHLSDEASVENREARERGMREIKEIKEKAQAETRAVEQVLSGHPFLAADRMMNQLLRYISR